MSKIVKLFATTQDARHWSARDVLNEAQEQLKQGLIKQDARVMVIHIDKENEEVGFVQNGLCSFSIMGLLELAKMKIYQDYIAKD